MYSSSYQGSSITCLAFMLNHTLYYPSQWIPQLDSSGTIATDGMEFNAGVESLPIPPISPTSANSYPPHHYIHSHTRGGRNLMSPRGYEQEHEEGCMNGHKFKKSEWIQECDCNVCCFPISIFDLFITYLSVIVIAFFSPIISSSWYH